MKLFSRIKKITPTIRTLVLRHVTVESLWNSSPEDWSPYHIHFYYRTEYLVLRNASLLKKTCKRYKKHRDAIINAIIVIDNGEILEVVHEE